ncbi:chromate transporter [Candidatus Uhrbacteria bacterium]|nr:chromate transporter [Candidatus Uhrbacteria bacterium]
MNQLEAQLVEFSKKLPQLPESARLLIVKFSPWIALILMIVALPAILFVLGLGAILAPFAFLGGATAGSQFTLNLVFLAILIVLEILAIPGLFKRARAGWQYSFYAALISGVEQLASFNLVGAIIGTAISLYFLFQIRQYYTPVPALSVAPKGPAPKGPPPGGRPAA